MKEGKPPRPDEFSVEIIRTTDPKGMQGLGSVLKWVRKSNS